MAQRSADLHSEGIREVKSEMRWPHKLDIVCTGGGAHKQAGLVQVWLDKRTESITIIGWPVSRNQHNVSTRNIEDRYQMIDGKDHVICNVCNQMRSFDSEEFTALMMELAWQNEINLDVSFANDLIPFALNAIKVRENQPEELPTRWQDVENWQNDPATRPPLTAKIEPWKAHAKHLRLNIDGMDRRQIIDTVLHYHPWRHEPRGPFPWPGIC